MDYFFNESSREKFSDLPFDGLTLIVGKPSQALLFRRSLWVYIQSMLDQLPAPLAYPLVSTRICLG
jgi:hypothetical protein